MTLLVVLVSMAVFLTAPAAQPYTVELDLDGVTGNGPDIGAGAVSDYFQLSVWIHGSPDLYGFRIDLCEAAGAL